MPLAGDVELKQNGLVPSARALTDATPLDVAIVDGNGDQLTGFDPSRPGTATITSVPSAITSSVLLAANPARRKVLVYNDSTKKLYVAFAATATTGAYTVQLPAGGFYESDVNCYTGVISGIWNAVNGNALVTSVTP